MQNVAHRHRIMAPTGSSASTGSSAPGHRHPVPLPWAPGGTGKRHDLVLIGHRHQVIGTRSSTPGHRHLVPLPWAPGGTGSRLDPVLMSSKLVPVEATIRCLCDREHSVPGHGSTRHLSWIIDTECSFHDPIPNVAC